MSDAGEPRMELPDDPDAALAGEYVLRLLDPDETAACAAREARDPAFAALVEEWRARLAGLDGAFAPAPPPAGLQGRIEARLFGTPARERSWLASIWGSAGLWRGVAAAAVLAAVYFGTQVGPLVTPPGEAPARLISALASVDSDVELMAFFEPQAAVLNINRTGGAPAPGRALELWAVVPGEDPVSLGVLPEEERARVPLTREQAALIGPGTTLAVSDEAPGGSTSGSPGTVLAAGPVTDI
jgi:anti-sigma-K factor RskA